eukprot:6206472-Pleurochrysis_carterae.AAC.1
MRRKYKLGNCACDPNKWRVTTVSQTALRDNEVFSGPDSDIDNRIECRHSANCAMDYNANGGK